MKNKKYKKYKKIFYFLLCFALEMNHLRDKLRNEHEEYNKNLTNRKYLPREDIESCKEISIKIERAIGSKREFVYFGGDFYKNFDCAEFKMLKYRYKNDALFNVHSPVSHMKISYNQKLDKVNINLI